MRCGLRRWLVVVACFCAPAVASADDEITEVFPGVALTEIEMGQLRGRGVSVICNSGSGDFASCLDESEVQFNDNSTNSSLNTIDESFEFADGILTITQFTGNGNRVDVFIQLEVNLNRVTVGEGAANVSVTQSLDFGSLTGGLQNFQFND